MQRRSITAEGLLAALEQGRRREEDWGSAIRWVVGCIVVVGVVIFDRYSIADCPASQIGGFRCWLTAGDTPTG